MTVFQPDGEPHHSSHPSLPTDHSLHHSHLQSTTITTIIPPTDQNADQADLVTRERVRRLDHEVQRLTDCINRLMQDATEYDVGIEAARDAHRALEQRLDETDSWLEAQFQQLSLGTGPDLQKALQECQQELQKLQQKWAQELQTLEQRLATQKERSSDATQELKLKVQELAAESRRLTDQQYQLQKQTQDQTQQQIQTQHQTQELQAKMQEQAQQQLQIQTQIQQLMQEAKKQEARNQELEARNQELQQHIQRSKLNEEAQTRMVERLSQEVKVLSDRTQAAMLVQTAQNQQPADSAAGLSQELQEAWVKVLSGLEARLEAVEKLPHQKLQEVDQQITAMTANLRELQEQTGQARRQVEQVSQGGSRQLAKMNSKLDQCAANATVLHKDMTQIVAELQRQSQWQREAEGEVQQLKAGLMSCQTLPASAEQQTKMQEWVQQQNQTLIQHLQKTLQDSNSGLSSVLSQFGSSVQQQMSNLAAAQQQIANQVANSAPNVAALGAAAALSTPQTATSSPVTPAPPTASPALPQSVQSTQSAVPAQSAQPVQSVLPEEFRLLKKKTAKPTGPVLQSFQSVQAAAGSTATISQVSVAPVAASPVAAAAPVAATVPTMTFLPPQLQQLLASGQPPPFSGRSEDWMPWRRKWLRYHAEMSDTYQLSEAMQIALLKSNVDRATAQRIESDVAVNPTVTYQEVFTRTDMEFGGANRDILRRQLAKLAISHRGRMCETDWRAVYTEAVDLQRQLGDVSDVELGRTLLKIIPTGPWRRNLMREALKLEKSGRLLLEGAPSHMTAAHVSELIREETGRQPADIAAEGKQWLVSPVDEAHEQQIRQALDTQIIGTGNRLQVMTHVPELLPKDINKVIMETIKLDNKIGSSYYQEEQPKSKSARRVKAQAEDSDEDAEVAQVVTPALKGKTPPKAAAAPVIPAPTTTDRKKTTETQTYNRSSWQTPWPNNNRWASGGQNNTQSGGPQGKGKGKGKGGKGASQAEAH